MSYDGIPCSATLKLPARTAYFSIGRHLEIELCGSKWISQALCAAFATLCSTSKSIAGLLMCFEKEGSVHEPVRGPIPPVPASPMAPEILRGRLKAIARRTRNRTRSLNLFRKPVKVAYPFPQCLQAREIFES